MIDRPALKISLDPHVLVARKSANFYDHALGRSSIISCRLEPVIVFLIHAILVMIMMMMMMIVKKSTLRCRSHHMAMMA